MESVRQSSLIDVRPVSEAVGAEVRGVDLARLTDGQFEAIRSAWHSHSALLFRRQHLTDDDLVAFSRRFGDLDMAPVMECGRTAVPGKPEVYVISNVLGVDGKPIGSLGTGEAVWHTDMSYLETPPDASALYALEVPEEGGSTWLCGMNAALGRLPQDLRRAIEGRSIKHDATYNSGGYLREGAEADDDPRTSPGAIHPIVCKHPDTGVPMLYLGRRRNAYVVGLPLGDSESLLDRLWAHATQPAFTYAHRWRVGDLLMWDNRCTLHRRDAFDQSMRRVMHRTQIRGKVRPLPAATVDIG